MSKKLAIAMFGQKRLSREGGVEIVVKELCTRMAQNGCDVTCYNRAGHHVSGAEYDDAGKTEYEGIRQKSVPTIERRGLAAVSSSFFAALYSAFGKYDVVHIHAEGPAFFCWLPKLFGKRVVVTIHGEDCFPKDIKQFLNHYYDTNEIFRGESQMKKNGEIKVCLVGSSGGHLTHLYMLKPFWKDKNRFWVTFDKEDARSLLEGEKVYPCYFPTNRSIKALIKNTKIAWDVLHKEKPDLIISCGAAVAVPFFYIGKMMGAKLVYIEVFDRIDKPTMTGKMVYPIVDKFVVQWEEQKKVYPKAVNLGSIF